MYFKASRAQLGHKNGGKNPKIKITHDKALGITLGNIC